MKNYHFVSRRLSASRNRVVSGSLLLAMMVVSSCELKTADFFTPDTRAPATPTLFDVDPPTFTNPSPRPQLPGPFSINSFQFDVNDIVGSNGVAASGVDWTTVNAMRASNGLLLPITHTGNSATGSLAGIGDGQLGINWTASDLRGNKSTMTQNFYLKNSGPVIGFTNVPQAAFSSSGISTPFSLNGTITDPYLNSAAGTISKPGVDGLCGTADDVLWPVGTGGGQVSANSFSYSSTSLANGTFNVDYTAYNGVPTGGQPTVARYCFQVTAVDKATDAAGTAKPNVTTKLFESSLTWMPLLPVVGSVGGAVTINGVGASGITVTAGGQTVATTGGTYRIDGLAPGSQTLTLGAIPAAVTCSPASKSVTIVAGGIASVDFACTQPTVGSITGSVTINGVGASGITVTAGGKTVATSGGTYSIDALTPGTQTVTLGAIPANVTCTPSAKNVTVVAGSSVTADFPCTQPVGFAVGVSMSYRHLGATSEVCAAITTTPAQPNAAYSGQVVGAGLVGNGVISGALNAAGTATARLSINQFGMYAGVINIGAQSQNFSVNVVAAAGSCPP